MSAFLWTMIAALGLSIAGKLCWFAKGELPARTRGSEAADVAINLALLVWAAVLLGGAA